MELNIKEFDKIWLDCGTSILFSILMSNNNPREEVIYNNNYTYSLKSNHTESGKPFQSIQLSLDGELLISVLLKNQKQILFNIKEEITNTIIDFLEQKKIIILWVDMYHWLPYYVDTYHINHFVHMAMVYGYDNEKKIFHVLDGGKKFTVTYEDLVLSINSGGNKSIVCDYAPETSLKELMLSDKSICDNAKKIMDSITNLISVSNDMWNINNFEEKDMNYLSVVLPTHIHSLRMKQRSNKFLFKYAFDCNDKKINLKEQFEKMELEYQSLKHLLIKACLSGDISKINEIKSRVIYLLKNEYKLWDYFLQDNTYKLIV
ncbi:BtrH N-terminal domain-containing protein [Clostridium felsineum]|uniref:Uncharacterized protein n=1 Tax=Clostridium felsineum TaxID=36839 RepID=A0A1S8KZ03_9CLOT|nr:BtrH N-terminal domain-containing protein [Clostridium felsineum]URZ07704.1 hypothetical protein CLROS_030650 [Clostridium felsineum]URZ12735.1 hypothetical protein CROST_034800 [Clostridium felsineum]